MHCCGKAAISRASAVRIQLVAKRGIGHRREIGAGAEVVALAGQDRHAQGGVGFEALERFAKFQRRGTVDGVALFRTVDGDDADLRIDFEVDKRHGGAFPDAPGPAR
jgi:hypothetical protein